MVNESEHTKDQPESHVCRKHLRYLQGQAHHDVHRCRLSVKLTVPKEAMMIKRLRRKLAALLRVDDYLPNSLCHHRRFGFSLILAARS